MRAKSSPAPGGGQLERWARSPGCHGEGPAASVRFGQNQFGFAGEAGRPHSGRVLRCAASVLALLTILTASLAANGGPASETRPPDRLSPGGPYAQVTVDATKTSIYIGSVSLAMPPFARLAGAFVADYSAEVFPFFFFNERGRISIAFSDENLRQLQRGETVYFTGHARTTGGAERRIEGRAIPDGANTGHGKIKVRVWVGKIELIFNTVYRFTGAE